LGILHECEALQAGGSSMTADNAPIVLAFIRAFDRQDLEGLAKVMDGDVVIHSAKGTRRGVEEALGWARRVETGELEQLIEVDRIELAGDRALALIRRQWWWRDENELAREDEMAWLFELREGRVLSWRPFEDRAEALAQLVE
jgi:limonene-1,2-epoxide hydrolase